MSEAQTKYANKFVTGNSSLENTIQSTCKCRTEDR